MLKNFSWKFFERISAQIVTVIVSIVLARMLSPNDYGIVAIVTVIMTFSSIIFIDGLGSSLIQKKEIDSLDYSSALYFNIFLAIILYIILFLSAPLITKFYGENYELLTIIIRVMGIRIIISAIDSVQQAYVSRHLLFKKLILPTFLAAISSGVIGITMAYSGYGIWSLVAQYLVNGLVNMIVLALVLRKKPILSFSITRVKNMLSFGMRILGSSLLITGFQEIKSLIIGKLYSSDTLAYYDKGRQFPSLIVGNVDMTLSSVLFPKMAKEQDDKDSVREITRNSIRFSSYLMCPLILGLAVVAEPFVLIILTDKWISCVPLLQLFCIIYLFQPIHTANMQAIKAIGRGDIYLKLEIFKKIIELIVLLITMWFSVEAILLSSAILTILFTFVNSYPNKKLLNYSFKQQMSDVLPAVGISILMAMVVFLFSFIEINIIFSFLLQIFVGIFVYLILSIITKNKEFKILMKLIRKR